jgi:CheY-like chemotaxis protein
VPQGVQFAAPPGQPQPGLSQAGQQQPAPFALPPGQPADAAGSNGTNGSSAVGNTGAGEVAAQNGIPTQHQRPSGQAQPAPVQDAEQSAGPQPEPQAVEHTVVAASPILGGGPLPPDSPQPQGPPMPGSQNFPGGQSPYETGHHQVRTLGAGVPLFMHGTGEFPVPQSYGQQSASTPAPPHAPSAPTAIPTTPSSPGSGRRRRLAAPPEEGGGPQQSGAGAQQAAAAPPPAREFTIGAPAAGAAEGPEPLDGPNSPVEVSDGRGVPVPPQAVDDELPPEPLDNPRRLLVWPEPDAATAQTLSGRGYRPVVVHSREEVDAQAGAYPAALFVDPLTGPITRTALQSLRTAAVAADVPVLVTAGLGQATREAAYGADPAVLLKALAPRDSEQHPPRVLLVEERTPIAAALAGSLQRRGIQVAHSTNDAEAVNVAAQARPNLVVMDLMQVRQRQAGIIDWLRVNGLLSRTPFVIYTSAGMNPAELPRLASGETVLFLAERATSDEVQHRIVDLLAKISAN